MTPWAGSADAMADVMSDRGVLVVFVRLRWRMLRGAFRTGGAQQLAVVVGLIGSALAGVVGGAVLLAVGRSTDDPVSLYVGAITGGVLVVMMVGVIAGVTQPVDPRVLATEPLAQRQLGIGLLAASAAGPPGLAAVLVGAGLFAGAVEDLASILPVTAAVVTFLAFLLLVSRTTINALGLLNTRSPRLGQMVVGLSSLAFYAAFQLVPRAVADLDDERRQSLVDAATWTPFGQIGRALSEADDRPAIALARVALASLPLLPLLWIFTWSTRRLVTSVRGGGAAPSRSRASTRRPITTLARWLCGSGITGATAWRSVLTRFRTPRTALETFTGGGIGLAVVLVPVLSANGVGAGAVLVGGAVQLAVLFMAGNSFGSDGPALSNELLTGIDPKVVVRGKARAVVVSASPIALVGPLIAAAFTDEWRYLPAGVAIGIGGLFAGAGAAMVQSAYVPIAIPESDNPMATGDSGRGWFSALMLAIVVTALAVLTLPLALALLWALDRESLALVTVLALATLAAGMFVQRTGVTIAANRLRDFGPELYADIVPAR